MSPIDHVLASSILPTFTPAPTATEPPRLAQLINKLHMQKHPEGGYFVETDRDALLIPNPFQPGEENGFGPKAVDTGTRSASTTIFYLLTPSNPQGAFHRNKGRTMHTLHKGRGRYIIIHADEREKGHKARVEVFTVGQDVEKGERLQWLVEGGKYKSSFLLPDEEGKTESGGLLISEVGEVDARGIERSKTPLL